MKMDADAHYDKALELYDDGFYLKDIDDIKSIIKALEHFTKANKVLEKYSILRPKTLCYIALCNYKIDNIEAAYQIAHKAKAITPLVVQKIRYISGVTEETIGMVMIDNLIQTIEEGFYERIKNVEIDIYSIDENHIDLTAVSKYIN